MALNPNSMGVKRNELKNTADSFRWLIKERLVSIDNITRKMQDELRTMSVPKEMIAEYLPILFAEIAEEVQREQDEREKRDVKFKRGAKVV